MSEIIQEPESIKELQKLEDDKKFIEERTIEDIKNIIAQKKEELGRDVVHGIITRSLWKIEDKYKNIGINRPRLFHILSGSSAYPAAENSSEEFDYPYREIEDFIRNDLSKMTHE